MSRGIAVESDLGTMIETKTPEVVIDFTTPATVMKNIITALEHQVHIVVGTTGLTEDDLDAIDKLAREKRTSGFCCSQFCIRRRFNDGFCSSSC